MLSSNACATDVGDSIHFISVDCIVHIVNTVPVLLVSVEILYRCNGCFPAELGLAPSFLPLYILEENLWG